MGQTLIIYLLFFYYHHRDLKSRIPVSSPHSHVVNFLSCAFEFTSEQERGAMLLCDWYTTAESAL